MKVLIIGSGGREHAIAAAVAKSKRVSKIYAAPNLFCFFAFLLIEMGIIL